MTTLRFWRAASKRRFVHQVGQVGAGEARRAARQHAKGPHRRASGIFLVWTRRISSRPFTSGTAHHHAAVETARPQQRRIEHVRAVGGRHQDHAFVRFKAVHLHQQLVEGLLALVVPAAQTGAAMAADGVDFVDEDDAGRVLLALLEQVAHAARAHAHEHLHEVRTGDGEERHVGFAGDRAGQQGLAGSRRSDQQHALRNAAAQLLELLRLAQELDDLLQFFLGLFHAGHVLERDLLLLRGVQPRAALAEAQRLVAAALHLPHHEDPEREQQDERHGIDEDGDPTGVVGLLHRDVDVLLPHQVDRLLIAGDDVGTQFAVAVLEDPVHLGARDGHLLHAPFLNGFQEFAEGECGFGARSRLLDDSPQQYGQANEHNPENGGFDV